MAKQPSIATVKALYAKSKNQCTFPKCLTPLVDQESGKVTGRISHIRARSPGGPRYDPTQADDERHSVHNLILLCPVHHDVIDDDPDAYTVERLVRMKRDHEGPESPELTISDKQATQFVTHIDQKATVIGGSIIFSQGQMGGQIAHQITNVGPQPRRVAVGSANLLVSELRKRTPENVGLTSILGDSEGYELAEVLKAVLTEAGWAVDGVNQAVYTGLPRGLIIKVPRETEPLRILLNWCNQAGLKPSGLLETNLKRTEIIVGANVP